MKKDSCACVQRKVPLKEPERTNGLLRRRLISRRKPNNAFLASFACVLVVVAITPLWSDIHNRKAMATTNIDKNENCVVHIHGLHHSGTGYTREAVYQGLGGDAMASKHSKTRTPQDEGQFLQDVFPFGRERRLNPELCGLSSVTSFSDVAHLYSCPELSVSIVKNDTDANVKLHSQWSRYWNTSKPYLIQKTPNMIISLLERLKLHPTTHVIVMRHPFAWNWPFPALDASLVEKADFQPMVWLHVWTYALDLVKKEMIESFAIVNYEMLISRKEAVTEELVDVINRGCGTDVTVKKQTKATESNFARRRLELHTNKFNASMYVAESKIVKAFSKCERDVKCRKLMDDMAPILAQLGYTWNPRIPFQMQRDDSLILFTPDRLPSKELVEQMKALSAKHRSEK